jgi:hypothetical protein
MHRTIYEDLKLTPIPPVCQITLFKDGPATVAASLTQLRVKLARTIHNVLFQEPPAKASEASA